MKLLGSFSILFACVLTVCSKLALAQDSNDVGLVLHATRNERKVVKKEGDRAVLTMKLSMQFENKGSEPIILINPALGFGTGLKEVAFYFSDYDPKAHKNISDIKGLVKSIEPTSINKDSFRTMAPLFDREKPPENLTIILPPNGTLSFEDNFEVADSYRYFDYFDNLGKYLNRKDEKLNYSQGTPFYGAEYIRLTYEFSFLPYLPDADALEKLSFKWRRFGRLPVGTNGTYRITSEAIK